MEDTEELVTEGADTATEGDFMVFVKVRETYDLHTIQNKMTIIAIHTPKSDIVKRNFPGLLMQCRMWRPYSCDVRVACASVQPMDPLGVGTSEGDIAPEDVFNPILYKAMSNVGMSQLESRICSIGNGNTIPNGDGAINGESVAGDIAGSLITTEEDEFPIYYGLLSNSHNWRHANPQSGFSMEGLRPIVYEMLYNVGDNHTENTSNTPDIAFGTVLANGTANSPGAGAIRGNGKPLPMINTTCFGGTTRAPGFDNSPSTIPGNSEQIVPSINVTVGAIIVPPSRLHQLFYRMVVEWTLEFSSVRPLSEIANISGLALIGNSQHYQSYDFSATKKALVGDDVPDLLTTERSMVSANVDINKVM